MTSTRKWIAVATTLLLLAITAGIWWFVLGTPGRGPDAATTIGGVLAPLALLASIAPALWRWAGGHADSDEQRLRRAADELAQQIRIAWQIEARQRRITVPATVMVEWQWATNAATSPIAEVFEPGPAGTGAQPLVADQSAEPLTNGTIVKLHDLYVSLPYGRLVLIGEPGTGKTGALLLLLLAALDHRASQSGSRATDTRPPVPVLLPLTDWNPEELDLTTWAAQLLRRDHAYLESQSYGGSAPERLIQEGRVSLFLDGLDEMPERLREHALKRISELDAVRIVLTCRTDEYINIGLRAFVPRAAVVALAEVSPEAATAYLLAGHALTDVPRWQRFAQSMQRESEDLLAHTLNTPLMLSLVRSAYASSDSDPNELLNRQRFSTSRAVREYLLERVVRDAFPSSSRWRSVAFLTWIAQQMQARETRDFEWWNVRRWTANWLPPTLASCAFIPLAAAGAGALSDVRLALILGGSATALAAITSSTLYTFGSKWWPNGLRGTAPSMIAALCIGLFGIEMWALITLTSRKLTAAESIVVIGVLGPAVGVLASLVALRGRPARAYVRVPSLAEVTIGLVGATTGGTLAALASGLRAGVLTAVLALVGLSVVAAWTRTPERPREYSTPWSSYASDLTAGVLAGAIGFLSTALLVYFLLPTDVGFRSRFMAAALTAAGVGLGAFASVSQAVAFWVATRMLWLTRRSTSRPARTLRSAANGMVLRHVGTVYQFRHGEIQDFLAATDRTALKPLEAP